MSLEITDDKNLNDTNSMIIKDILNELPFDNTFDSKENQNETKGIPLSRLIDLEKQEKLLPILKCKICSNILLNPYDCSKCGNTFCFNCINNYKELNKNCPFGCVDYDINPSSFAIKKFLEKLQFTCANKSNGCTEIINYNNLENHESNCKFREIICPNNQCGQKIQWNLLKNHLQNECEFSLFECQYCGIKLTRKELVKHCEICGIINKEFNIRNPISNKLGAEEISKNNEKFKNIMSNIENLSQNEEINILLKTLVFTLSNKFSNLETQMMKINSTIQQFSENNLVFYKSINDELENINKKLINKEKNENISISTPSNHNNTYNNDTNEIIDLSSPTNANQFFVHKTSIFPNLSNKKLKNNFILEERNNPTNLEVYTKSGNNKEYKKKQINIYNNNIINNNEKYKTNLTEVSTEKKNNKKGAILNSNKSKEKFNQNTKPKKNVDKSKGGQSKKNNNTFTSQNSENKNKKNDSGSENIYTNQRILTDKIQNSEKYVLDNSNKVSETQSFNSPEIDKNKDKAVRNSMDIFTNNTK